MFKFAATAILAIALCLGGRAIPPASGYEAGLATLSLTDPVEGGPMTAIVVYPTDADPKGGPPAVSDLGPFHVAAATGVPPAAGPFPLIVVSHGTGGSSLGHHDSATALARAGFVVASIEHPRDNYRDDSGFGTDIQLYGRPHHIVALIDALLASPVFGPRVDRGAGIGMAGHSAGGYTALAIAGAVPDLSLSAAYRAALPADTYGLRADTAGPFRRRPDLHPIADPRVRSIFIMAPALGYLFDKPGLADVRVPVSVWRATADELLPHPWNVERIATLLPAPPDYHLVEGAGHFVFLAPCTEAFARRTPVICNDPPGIDRVAFHEQLNTAIIAFFRRTLRPR